MDPASLLLSTPEPIPTTPPLNGLATSAEIMAQQNTVTGPTPTPTIAPTVSLGPKKTGKTLVDLGKKLGLPTSLGLLIDDMQEAVLGITGDVLGRSKERQSLADILTYKNRLRGLGALCIFVAVVAILLDAIVGDSL